MNQNMGSPIISRLLYDPGTYPPHQQTYSSLVWWIGSWVMEQSGDSRATYFLIQKVAIDVHRGNVCGNGGKPMLEHNFIFSLIRISLNVHVV